MLHVLALDFPPVAHLIRWPNFWLKNVDVNTGKTFLNEDLIFRNKGEEKIICFFNTRSYWAQGYSPITNSLYVPFVDTCNEEKTSDPGKRSSHNGVVRVKLQ